jgi:hypothetical protein
MEPTRASLREMLSPWCAADLARWREERTINAGTGHGQSGRPGHQNPPQERGTRPRNQARLDVSEETGLSADLANRASAVGDPDRARRRRTIRQEGAPPDWRGCIVSASG